MDMKSQAKKRGFMSQRDESLHNCDNRMKERMVFSDFHGIG